MTEYIKIIHKMNLNLCCVMDSVYAYQSAYLLECIMQLINVIYQTQTDRRAGGQTERETFT